MTTSLKIVLLGDSGVGKTCISNAYLSGEFNSNETPTIGGVFGTKIVRYENEQFELLIWDTAGQELYRGLAPMYYRNSQIAIIVYDITDVKSFQAVEYWIDELRGNVDDTIIIMICGNKVDLDEARTVDSQEAQAFAAERKALYTETSASTGSGIERMFQIVTQEYLKSQKESQKADSQTSITAELKERDPSSKSGCC